MRALLFGLIALTLALFLAPTDPPVPEAAVVEAPPLRGVVPPPFPEYSECLRWIDRAEWQAGRFGSTPNPVHLWYRRQTSRRVSLNVGVNGSDEIKYTYCFTFDPSGSLQRLSRTGPPGEYRLLYPKAASPPPGTGMIKQSKQSSSETDPLH